MEKTDIKIKKNDMIVIGILLVAAVAAFFGLRWYEGANTKEAVAVVIVDGQEYGRYPLSEETEETIELPDGNYNTFIIKEGELDMTDASCPDKICVNHRHISKRNESIVCLPDKVVIQIENGEEAQLDAFTQ